MTLGRLPLQVTDKRFSGLEALYTSAPDVLMCFALASLPLVRPEVRLRYIDQALLADADRQALWHVPMLARFRDS